MSEELFNEGERELINAARMILSDGVRRLSEREGLFATNQTRGYDARQAVISARGALVDYLVTTYGPLRHEVAACCLIDAQGRLISVEDFPQGRATMCEINPRVLAGMVIRSGATAVILAHNHPSGDSIPSRQDITVTGMLTEWLKSMDVQLIDHLVITAGECSAIKGDF